MNYNIGYVWPISIHDLWSNNQDYLLYDNIIKKSNTMWIVRLRKYIISTNISVISLFCIVD